MNDQEKHDRQPIRLPNGYIQVFAPNHLSANTRGYVYEHVLVASAALGRLIPEGGEVHHVDGDRSHNRKTNLVLCDSTSYHRGLHSRQRALRACGNASWKRCKFCKEWDALENLYVPPSRKSASHRICQAAYARRWRAKERIQK